MKEGVSVEKSSPPMFRKEVVKDAPGNKSEQFKNRPGYSSGGSSFLDSSDEEMVSVRRCTRHDKLCEWKQELSNNGDLTTKIVRIEVSVCERTLLLCQFSCTSG